MATVAEFTLEPGAFPLGTAFETLPDATVELESAVPDTNGDVPYFWVRDTETDDVVARFSDHPGVEDIRLVDCVEGEYLMRCRWAADHETILDAVKSPGIVLCSAVGTAEGWTFEIRGETREHVAEFRESCHDRDISVTLTGLNELGPLEKEYDLTDKQREALILAYESGYFNSPRETALEDVATELGISQQALASRLRRGNRRLIEQSLVDSCS